MNLTNSLLSLPPKQALVAALIEKQRRLKERKILSFYPDEGPLRRELYQKHLEFFRVGVKKRQRLALAANRVGKTEGMGLYELTIHCTGWYPEWWEGRRFDQAVRTWAAGDSGKTVREILQLKLLGTVNNYGTGLIPGECIEKVTRGSGVADSVEIIYVKHKSGGTSTITLKSYDQGVEAFQGTEIDVILLDEEPPEDIYTECLLRTMTNNGMIMCTFTPLLGISDVVLKFLPGGKLNDLVNQDPSKHVVMATWDDVPHLTKEAKDELWANIPPFQRDARSRGIPQLGAGAIFPVDEDDFVVDDFPVPEHWPRVYALDVGWRKTAALWGAYDAETETWYMYSEYYRSAAEPPVHATGIKARGEWIKGVIDPAARGRNQKDGSKLKDEYETLGLKLFLAKNAVEAGIHATWVGLSTGKVKVFKSLRNFLSEYRLYRRDEEGKVVKENDHLMDTLRYIIMTGKRYMRTMPEDWKKPSGRKRGPERSYSHGEGWME